MSSKIYLVTQGEYSDYRVVGYFTDEEKAEKFCIIKNKSNYYDRYEVEECESFEDTQINYDSVKLVKYYRVNLAYDNKIDVEVWYKEESEKLKMGFMDYSNNSYKHYVGFYKAKNEEIAKKCFYDDLAKHKAKSEGL